MIRSSADTGSGERLPHSVVLRRGSLEDEHATFEVMRRAMGYDLVFAHHEAARTHMRLSPNSSYWVAEEKSRTGKPRIVGYAHSMVREQTWQLTEFFVLPSHHRLGIGQALLAHCLEEGKTAGAVRRFVLASHDPGADSLYMRKAGCYPRLPMLLLAGSAFSLTLPERCSPILDTVASPDASRLLAPGETARGMRLLAEPIVLTPAVQQQIDALDRETIGYARSEEHRFWAAGCGGEEGRSRLFRCADNGPQYGNLVGYAYYGKMSSGPALAVNAEELPRMIEHVTHLRRPGIPRPGFLTPDPYWAVPGCNTTILQWMLQCGWHITYQYLYMSSEPVGSLERYVCHNPLHFF